MSDIESQELVEDGKEEDNNEEENQEKRKLPQSLKIGDIIYLSCSLKVQGELYKGIAQGDGTASDNLYSIPKNDVRDIGFSSDKEFEKSLFQVRTPMNTKVNEEFQRKAHKQLKLQQQEEFLRLKRREDEENEQDFLKARNMPVLYGQAVVLKHIYSRTYLQIDPNLLAKENGCIEVSLQAKYDSKYSVFQFVPTTNFEELGNAIDYTDIIKIQSNYDKNTYLNIYQDQYDKQIKKHGDKFVNENDPDSYEYLYDANKLPLEINGSERATPWSLKCMEQCLDFARFDYFDRKFLASGDVIYLKNQETNAFLSVSEKKLVTSKAYLHQNMEEELQQIFGVKEKTIEMKIIQSNQKHAFKLFCLDQKTKTFYSIWEIQKLKPFQGYACDYNMYFRIKNIATGLFLAHDGDSLSLTERGNQRQCHFKFLPRKKQDELSEINNSGLVKIQTYKEKGNKQLDKLLQIHEELEEDLIYSVKVDKQCLSSSKMLWQLQPIDQDTQQSASRIASLYPALMKFYIFFQNWGTYDETDGRGFAGQTIDRRKIY